MADDVNNLITVNTTSCLIQRDGPDVVTHDFPLVPYCALFYSELLLPSFLQIAMKNVVWTGI